MDVNRVLFVYNAEKPGAEEVASRGEAWCGQRGIAAVVTPRRSFSAADVDLVVAIGGDGTLLRAAAAIYPREIPILGVHMGSLGFLASCRAGDLEAALEAVMAGRARLGRHARLMIPGRDETALNDVAVIGIPEVRFTELSVRSREEILLDFPGDGVIIATPTGTSAYALSCGGPLVHPDVPALEVTPIAPHKLGLRPLLVPLDEELSVEVRFPAEVWLDGDRVFDLSAGGKVTVRRAPASTVLVRLPGEESYFTRLRRRLA